MLMLSLFTIIWARQIAPLRREEAATVQVFFRPYDNCEAVIIDLIKQTKKEILILAYSFNNLNIIAALNQAADNGVKIIIVCDKGQFRSDFLNKNLNPKINIYVAKPPRGGIAHNKIMIFDKQTVLTGSYNFSRNTEEKNNENIVLMASSTLAEKYYENWLGVWQRSLTY